MKKRYLLIPGFLIMFSPANYLYAGNNIDFKISTDYYSKYIWRGQNVNNRSVFEPAIFLGIDGFSIYAWGNMDATNEHNKLGEFTEIDLVADYTSKVPGIDWLNYSLGTIHYRFPNTSWKPTTEIYGGLSINCHLNPSIKLFRDLDETDGTYIQFSIGHTVEKVAKISEDCYCGLQVGLSIGWANQAYNKFFFNKNSGAFNDLVLSAGLPFCMGKWTVRPGLNYSSMLSGTVRSATDQSDNLWGGISVIRSF
jgi:hypothetical protein